MVHGRRSTTHTRVFLVFLLEIFCVMSHLPFSVTGNRRVISSISMTWPTPGCAPLQTLLRLEKYSILEAGGECRSKSWLGRRSPPSIETNKFIRYISGLRDRVSSVT